jgi:hypothetical protein
VTIHVSIKEAKNRLCELLREVEAGEHIVITRNGRFIAELGQYGRSGGINRKALDQWKFDRGYQRLVGPPVGDFDEPLPEDILIRPLG